MQFLYFKKIKMKFLKSRDFSFFFFFLAWRFTISGFALAESVTFYIQNKCNFPIWPATAPNTGYTVIADGGFFLPAGKTHRIYAPSTWTGRIWGRTGCNFTNSHPACETGDCNSQLACNGLIGTPPATLFQLSLQSGKPSFYDISLVDGYNLPMSVETRPVATECTIKGCGKNLNELCPEELRVLNKLGQVVACKSACLGFNLDNFCCRNEYGTPLKCKPNVYSKIFKDACHGYYSYAYDSPPPLMSCVAKEFVVAFCPSNWGGDEEISTI